jgi:hypothetical protein
MLPFMEPALSVIDYVKPLSLMSASEQ